MNLFAYISLGELGKVLQRQVADVGSRLDSEPNRVCSQGFDKDEKYLVLFEDLEAIKVMQRFYGDRPEFLEGGVVVRVNVPKRLVLPREGLSIFKFQDKTGENFVEIKTYPIETKSLRIDNFEDVVFDQNCSSFVEDIKEEFNSVSVEKF